jgi:hypothetical protein
MRRLSLVGAALAAMSLGLVSAVPASAEEGTQHYGPFASGSTDSGTCGNDWANDTYDRHFTVRTNEDGTLTVVEQFKDGTFITPASDSPAVNFSPGACQTSSTPAGVIRDGVTGKFKGEFIIPVPAGFTQTSASSHCDAVAGTDAGCSTATFINTHFSCTYLVTCQVTTFLFHYAADGQDLVSHEWTNASADRGGNSGDIRSSNLP